MNIIYMFSLIILLFSLTYHLTFNVKIENIKYTDVVH